MTSFIANPGNIGYALQTVIAMAVAAIFIMSIVSFFLAIRDFIRSEGEEEAKKKGRNRIRFMMIGLLLTIVFLFLLPLLIKYLGISQYELFNAQSIFSRIGELMNQLFSMGSQVQKYYNKGAVGLGLQGTFTTQPATTPADYTL